MSSKLSVTPGLLAQKINAYSDAGYLRKQAFHREGRTFLKRLASALALARGTFEVRSNKAGIAVSGEVTLHSDTLYVQLYEGACGRAGVSILYRRCKGRRDYCGETNHFAHMTTLAASTDALDAFVRQLRVLGGLVDPVQEVLARTGRTVRCAHCGTAWDAAHLVLDEVFTWDLPLQVAITFNRDPHFGGANDVVRLAAQRAGWQFAGDAPVAVLHCPSCVAHTPTARVAEAAAALAEI